MNQYRDAIALSRAITDREITVSETIEKTLQQIQLHNPKLNCFTTVLAESAIAQAEKIDTAIARGENPGILAGVPFAVKNLFDIEGITTLAGSKIEREHPPATADATVIARLKQAGAILVGALNMDEYAYGFVTENSHYGATRNPHDLSRIAGGSSGGSAAAVAAKLVPLSLGSDTNGSVRVPAALCGVYGLKPTYGCLSRQGMQLFSSSLDCVGAFANSVRDLAVVFDILHNNNARLCLPELDRGIAGLKIAIADGYFQQGAEPEALEAVERVARQLDVTQRITIPECDRAKAAAYIITAVEGANLHLNNLQTRPQDFDPATRDRFLAGALIPGSWYVRAQQFRRWYRQQLQQIFTEVDLLLAPTTPCTATPLGKETTIINGEEILIRPNLGRFTQPFSFIGLPVLSIPIKPNDSLPIGVQIIAAPNRESLILRLANAFGLQS
ncbi:AtzE family amidohydrolase [Myxosarcina sp. GI1]|uniref:AtzE family amidohydrolase n=1 Tax=Myxosarcina sp. GI1 TaxID=1541065 RepID=UPI00055E1583|nr:AtzE family amidohydrolase [Myxosarcina sp. GI1]